MSFSRIRMDYRKTLIFGGSKMRKKTKKNVLESLELIKDNLIHIVFMLRDEQDITKTQDKNEMLEKEINAINHSLDYLCDAIDICYDYNESK